MCFATGALRRVTKVRGHTSERAVLATWEGEQPLHSITRRTVDHRCVGQCLFVPSSLHGYRLGYSLPCMDPVLAALSFARAQSGLLSNHFSLVSIARACLHFRRRVRVSSSCEPLWYTRAHMSTHEHTPTQVHTSTHGPRVHASTHAHTWHSRSHTHTSTQARTHIHGTRKHTLPCARSATLPCARSATLPCARPATLPCARSHSCGRRPRSNCTLASESLLNSTLGSPLGGNLYWSLVCAHSQSTCAASLIW
jgi:hypothetical protein